MLKDKTFWIINGVKTTQYLNLKRSAKQGDSIFAHFFTLALQIFLYLLKITLSSKV